MDDTLINSATAHMFSIKNALNDFNLEMKWEEIRRRFGMRFTQILKEVYGINDINLLKKIEHRKQEYFKKYINLVIPLPGANELFKISKNLGLKIALSTMSSTYETNLILDHFDWKKYFDVIVTGDGLPSRPNPALLKLTLKRMKLNSPDVINVGDSIYDVQSAKQLKVKFIGATTGIFDKVDLSRAGADYVVEDLFGVIDIVTWLQAQENKHLLIK